MIKIATMISSSGHDERNKYSGGAAGDQTGTEWRLMNWYSYPWNCVLRHPNPTVRAKLAELHTAAAKNDKIGYDQGQRDTYWVQLRQAGYDPGKITAACEADCSAGVIANVRAVGYLLGLDELKNVSASYTGNMRSGLKAAGFQVLTDSKYLTTGDYLAAGDILLNDVHHTAVVVTDGGKCDAPKIIPGWHRDATGWWYVREDGSYPVSAWERIEGKWYYFDKEGYMETNRWITSTGAPYYVGADGAMVTNKSVRIGADGALIPSGEWYDKLKDVPDYYRPEIDKLVASGQLRGNGGTGEDLVLDMSEEMVRSLVIMARGQSFSGECFNDLKA